MCVDGTVTLAGLWYMIMSFLALEITVYIYVATENEGESMNVCINYCPIPRKSLTLGNVIYAIA